MKKITFISDWYFASPLSKRNKGSCNVLCMLIKKTRQKNLFQFRTTDYCVLVIRLIRIKIKQTAYINTYPLTPEHTHNPTHNLTYPLTQHERPILRLVEWLPDGNLRLVEWLPEKFLQKTFLESPQCDKRWGD